MANKSFQSRRSTPWDTLPDRTATQEFLIRQHRQRYSDRHPALSDTGEEELINSFVPESCPYCNSPVFARNGFTKNRVQRYRCYGCYKTFTPVTGTIFEGHRISISEWVEYLLNIFRFVGLNADSWNNRNSITTSRYWLEKLFLVLEDYRLNRVLSGRICLDEFSFPSGEDKPLCIGIACTDTDVLCIREGYGRPARKKSFDAFKDHIEPGSLLVHTREQAHGMLIQKLGLSEELYDPKVLKTLPDKDNPFTWLNQIHAAMSGFLRAHGGFNEDSLQGYLDIVSFAMTAPFGYLEKVDELLNLSFRVRKTLRYRDFYS